MSLSQSISPREAESSQALVALVVSRVMLARTSRFDTPISSGWVKVNKRLEWWKTARSKSVANVFNQLKCFETKNSLRYDFVIRFAKMQLVVAVRNGRVGSSRVWWCTGIVTPARSDRLWGAGGGPGNRSGFSMFTWGASANEQADSWPCPCGAIGSRGRRAGGRQSATPRCTGARAI